MADFETEVCVFNALLEMIRSGDESLLVKVVEAVGEHLNCDNLQTNL